MTNEKFKLLGIVALFSACAPSGSNGAEAGENGGRAGLAGSVGAGSLSASGGSPGTGGGYTCPEFEPSVLAACWPDLGPQNPSSDWWIEGVGYVLPDLTVVGAVEPDIALCEQSFPIFGPDVWTHASASRAAWDLEDPVGNHWIVQFGIDGVSSDVLSSGDKVNFQFTPIIDTENNRHGVVMLERDGSPAVALLFDVLPDFAAMPDLAVEAGAAACASEEDVHCMEPRAVRVVANGDSADIPMRESAEVGGLVVYNNYSSDNRNCPHLPLPPVGFELGLYAR